jgi:chorismate mutase
MPVRGIRGAITVSSNTEEEILEATRTLLEEIIRKNEISTDDLANDLVSVTFTATKDLDAVYPAVAARNIGWTTVPLLCMQEMDVEGSLNRCVRVLIHWNTMREQSEMQHIYLGEARSLRPDLNKEA